MATASRSTAELNSLYTTTVEKWMGAGSVEDTVFEANQLSWLLSRASKDVGAYGFEMVQPIMTTKNSGVGWFEYNDALDTNAYGGPEAAKYGMKFLGGPLVITEQEEVENKEEHRRVGLLKFRYDQLQLSLAEEVNLSGFRGSGVNSKSIDGLEDMIFPGTNTTDTYTRTDLDAGVTNTYAGIDRSAASAVGWRNYCIDTGGYSNNFNDSSAVGAAGDRYQAFETLYHACSRGVWRPDVIVSDLAPYGDMHNAMSQQAQYRREVDVFKGIQLGFDNLKYRNAVWFYDEMCVGHADAGHTHDGEQLIYLLNSNFLRMPVEEGYDFTFTDFQTPAGSRVHIGHILWRGNVIVTNPRYFGVMVYN